MDEWSTFLAVKELLWLSVRVSSSPRHGSRYAQIDRICIQDGDDATALSSTPNGGCVRAFTGASRVFLIEIRHPQDPARPAYFSLVRK